MKKFIFVFAILTSVKIKAQDQKYIDSLKNVLLTNKEDTTKVRNSMYMADAYVWSQPDSALHYAGKSLALSEKLRDTFGQVFNLGTLSYIYSMRRNDSLALATIFRSMRLSETSNLFIKGFSYNDISIVYYNLGEYRKGIQYAYELKNMFSTDTGITILSNALIGKNFYALNELDSATIHLESAYKQGLSRNVVRGESRLYLANIYREKGNYEKAFEFYRNSIHISLTADYNLKNVMDGYLGIAKTFEITGMRDSAFWYAQKAFYLATGYSFPVQKLQACILLKELYHESNTIDSAYKYQALTLTLKDSLFNQEKIRAGQNLNFQESQRQASILAAVEAGKASYRNRIKIYTLVTGLILFFLIALILWRSSHHKQKANCMLQKQKMEIEKALSQLKATQSQLVQSEKMASLGELTAGIAHEIQNPLNFVNNFSEVNAELIEEMVEEVKKGNTVEAETIANDIKQNLEKINHHGKRADAIVKGMLQHSRSSNGQKELTDINELADEYLRLAYHGLRAKDKSFNATLKTDFDKSIGKINIIPQDIGRVILNLITNAFYVVDEKKKSQVENYEPTVFVSTKKINNRIEIMVKDNGNGIPQKLMDKIFQPFFTTKPTGQGTGLGLSLSYDIVKAHGGELKVETKENEGAAFIIQLPFA